MFQSSPACWQVLCTYLNEPSQRHGATNGSSRLSCKQRHRHEDPPGMVASIPQENMKVIERHKISHTKSMIIIQLMKEINCVNQLLSSASPPLFIFETFTIKLWTKSGLSEAERSVPVSSKLWQIRQADLMTCGQLSAESDLSLTCTRSMLEQNLQEM